MFKAYDIRGIYPTQIDEVFAYKIGQAYCNIIKPKTPVVVGMDIRTHSESLKKSLISGIIDAGVDVIDVGLISTEMLYFAVGNYGYSGGIQVTASHNTAEYNGFKMTRAEALPISSDTGLLEMKDYIVNYQGDIKKEKLGTITKKNILDDFSRFILGFIKKDKIKSLRVAYNPNFGIQGEVLKRIIEIGGLDIELFGLNHIPDGSFPKGAPNPLEENNRIEFSDFIKRSDVDIGVAWDADGDRVFFHKRDGTFISPYHIGAILIKRILEGSSGKKIIYDPRYTWALIDATKPFNGVPIIERVGHSFIKARMRKEDAIFGSESSGHFYFKDFWFADSGIIPFLMIMEIISSSIKLEEILDPLLDRYLISGEVNMKSSNPELALRRLGAKYSDAKISKIDGLSIEYNNWRANIRKSNTEPLFRINVEGNSSVVVEQKKRELLGVVLEVDKE